MSQQHPQQHNNIYRQNITSFSLEKIYKQIIHLDILYVNIPQGLVDPLWQPTHEEHPERQKKL